jgi:hypothetical protein
VQKERIVSNNIYDAVEYVLTNPSRITREGGTFLGTYTIDGINYNYYMSNNNKIIYIFDNSNNLIMIVVSNGTTYRVNSAGNLSSSTDSSNSDYFARLGDKIRNGIIYAFRDKVGGAFVYAFRDKIGGGLITAGEGAKKFFTGGYF